MDYTADLFTINMDLTNDFLSSTAFFIMKTVSSFDGKVHIINYSDTNLKDYLTLDDSKKSEFDENTKDIIKNYIFS